MTTTAGCRWDSAACWWNRQGKRGPWWVTDESPGLLGEREIWVDEAALDMYGRGDAEPAVTMTGGREYGSPSGNWWGGAVIRFNRYPGLAVPVVYRVTCRQWSRGNGGRPYYVLEWPD